MDAGARCILDWETVGRDPGPSAGGQVLLVARMYLAGG